ncbi:MAG TPA: hypothetical protein PKM50_06370 [Methanoregula sp.]|nr:hypothetical protein [Methanoregula sp.]
MAAGKGNKRSDNAEYRGHGRHMLIPAGIFLGLGIGLLAGYPSAGILIGLGFGFAGAMLVKPAPEPAGDAGTCKTDTRPRSFLALIGTFLILIGIGIIFAPQYLWPWIVSIFLIMLGGWFLYREF